ncbi:MAG TPA: Uma2 family endonuclease, partial [Chloroflexota bacterium]
MSTRVPEFEIVEMGSPFLLRWKNPPDFSRDELLEFIETNDIFEVERECDGSLLLSSGVTLYTNSQEMEVYFQLRLWAERDGRGDAYGPTGRYELPNRASRGPDVAWILKERIASLPAEELDTVPRLVPDFVVEVRSKSNSLGRLQEKMQEYMANGVRLGWLLNAPT